jgi:hypothetical protein
MGPRKLAEMRKCAATLLYGTRGVAGMDAGEMVQAGVIGASLAGAMGYVTSPSIYFLLRTHSGFSCVFKCLGSSEALKILPEILLDQAVLTPRTCRPEEAAKLLAIGGVEASASFANGVKVAVKTAVMAWKVVGLIAGIGLIIVSVVLLVYIVKKN